MWQCDCGEFNNEESAYCVRCNKLRVIQDKAATPLQVSTNTQSVFRRIQDLILLDIGVTALLVVYCFWRASQTVEITGPDDQTFTMPAFAFDAVIPLLVIVLLQMALLVHLLRVFYRTAVNSERNSIFLQKIYEKHEGILDEEEEKETTAQSLVKPPTSTSTKETPIPPVSAPRRGRGRPPRGRNSH